MLPIRAGSELILDSELRRHPAAPFTTVAAVVLVRHLKQFDLTLHILFDPAFWSLSPLSALISPVTLLF